MEKEKLWTRPIEGVRKALGLLLKESVLMAEADVKTELKAKIRLFQCFNIWNFLIIESSGGRVVSEVSDFFLFGEEGEKIKMEVEEVGETDNKFFVKIYLSFSSEQKEIILVVKKGVLKVVEGERELELEIGKSYITKRFTAALAAAEKKTGKKCFFKFPGTYNPEMFMTEYSLSFKYRHHWYVVVLTVPFMTEQLVGAIRVAPASFILYSRCWQRLQIKFKIK